MSKLTRILTTLALVAAPAACKSETARRADKAADHAADKTQAMNDQAMEESKTVTDESAKTEEKGADVVKAKAAFESERDTRVQTLEQQRDLAASQVTIINALATGLPLAPDSKASVDDKVSTLQSKLDDAGNAIQDLKTSTADDFKAKEDHANDTMKSLDDARGSAWQALNDAKKQPEAQQPQSSQNEPSQTPEPQSQNEPSQNQQQPDEQQQPSS
jgi:hypothetical protein